MINVIIYNQEECLGIQQLNGLVQVLKILVTINLITLYLKCLLEKTKYIQISFMKK